MPKERQAIELELCCRSALNSSRKSVSPSAFLSKKRDYGVGSSSSHRMS